MLLNVLIFTMNLTQVSLLILSLLIKAIGCISRKINSLHKWKIPSLEPPIQNGKSHINNIYNYLQVYIHSLLYYHEVPNTYFLMVDISKTARISYIQ